MGVAPVESPGVYWGQDGYFGPNWLVSEDEAGRCRTPSGELFVIACGLAGQTGGGVPARLAVAAFQQYCLAAEEGSPEDVLKGALMAADGAVAAAGAKHLELWGLRASLAALLWRRDDGEAWHIHWGDSRLYCLSADGLYLLAGDPGGRLPAAWGLGDGLDPGTLSVGRRACREEDIFLLCAGGLSKVLPEGTLGKILSEPVSPRERAQKLIEAAVAAGSEESLTAQVVAFRPGPPEAAPRGLARFFEAWERRRLKKFGQGLFWGLTLGLVMIGIWLLFK